MCITVAHLWVSCVIGITRDTAFKECLKGRNGLYVSKNTIAQLKDSTKLFNIFLLRQWVEWNNTHTHTCFSYHMSVRRAKRLTAVETLAESSSLRQKQGENRKSFASALYPCQSATGSLYILYTLLPLSLQIASFISLSAISSVRWVTPCQMPPHAHFPPHLSSFPLKVTLEETLQQMKPHPDPWFLTLNRNFPLHFANTLDWNERLHFH